MSAKNKLKRFAENETFENVIQPVFSEVFNKDYHMKGQWHREFFKNDNPLVLELGCGKGEYTVNLARKFPDKNFLGIDIKGARFWRGAKTAVEEGLDNVGFLRTQIEFVESFFAADEVSEIWITFPDPQLRRSRAKKRLTSPFFLNRYKKFLQPEGIVNLKTDSAELHCYTKALLEYNEQATAKATDDLYNSDLLDDTLSIKTAYETMFLREGKKITYLAFRIDEVEQFEQLPPELLF